MKPFRDLTRIGQSRRLRSLALQTLCDDYALVDVRVHLVAMHSFNTIFRVETPSDRFALRVGDSCRIHPTGVEEIEAMWLDALTADGFGTATIVPTSSGRAWTTAVHEGVPASRVCTLFTWVPGTELRRSLDAEGLNRAGRLFARLHQHASTMTADVPVELHTRKAIYFAGTDLVAHHQHPHRSLFLEATERVQQLIDHIWGQSATAPGPHLLHGDFSPGNILRYRDQCTPIDFQDMRFGFAEQDLGITLSDLGRVAGPLVPSFLQGYRDVCELPDLSPDRLAIHAAARNLNIMNLALHAPHTPMGATFDTFAQRVIDWMT